jgi:hypothetical protein
VPPDRLNHLPVPSVFPLHVNGDQRVRRGYQQQNVENQAENKAKHDQNEIEDCRKRLPVQQQPKRRQQGGQDVNHDKTSGVWTVHTSVTPDLGGLSGSAIACATGG